MRLGGVLYGNVWYANSMRNWNIGTNSVYKTASISLEEGPLWAFLIDELSTRLCDLIPPIPFPKIGKIVDEETGGTYNWREWHGDLRSWWHSHIDEPLTWWIITKRIKTKPVDVNYKLALKLHRKHK